MCYEVVRNATKCYEITRNAGVWKTVANDANDGNVVCSSPAAEMSFLPTPDAGLCGLQVGESCEMIV